MVENIRQIHQNISKYYHPGNGNVKGNIDFVGTDSSQNITKNNKLSNLLRQLLQNLPGKSAGLLGRLQRQPGRVFKTVKTRVPIARSRKALLFFAGILIILLPVAYLILKNPKEIKAATVELSTTSSTVQIDVANRYRAILDTDDTYSYLTFKDRAENDGSPDTIVSLWGPRLKEENVGHWLAFDDNRKTTILESNSTRVKLRVEGCFDTDGGGSCLTDGTDDVTVTQEITFTTEGAYFNTMFDFHTAGITLDGTDYVDYLTPFGEFRFNLADAPSAYSETIIYGDGEDENTLGTTGNFNDKDDVYMIAQATNDYQDIVYGTMNLNGNGIISISNNSSNYYAVDSIDEAEEIFLEDTSYQTLRGQASAQTFVLFKDQRGLDTEAEREALFNDLTNPDYLSHTVGELLDNKPSGDFLFASGFEGADPNLCDGGDGWTGGNCESGNTAVGNETAAVYKSSYSAKFTSGGTNDQVQVYKNLGNSYGILYARLYFRLNYEGLGEYEQLLFLGFQDSVAWQSNYVGISQRPSGNLELFAAALGEGTLAGSDGYIQLDTWYELEFRMYRHSTNGTLDLWLDGNHILNVPDAYTGDTDMDYVWVGMGADSINSQIFIDNVIVSESYIGPSHYNEAEGAYTTDMLSSEAKIDIDAGVNVSTLIDGTGAEAGDISITVDSTTGFPSSGVAYIKGDKFSYTGTTSTTFTGIPSSGELSIIGHADNSVVSSSQRHTPLYKLRNYRKNDAPQSITLEKDTLTLGTEYNTSVKPFTTSYFAQDLVWYSTLESASAVTSPNVGSAGAECGTAPTYPAGKYGDGALFDDEDECVYFPATGGDSANFDKAKGAIEFWYQPENAHNDNNTHYFFINYYDPNNVFEFYKSPGNYLMVLVKAGGTETKTTISSSNYSWSPRDWVHLRLEWDDSASVAEQFRIYVNGVEPTHDDDPESDDYISGNLTLGANSSISSSGSGLYADGIIDEFRVYDFNGSGDQAELGKLSVGGNGADSDEYLADPTNNYTFDFNNDDANNRGEYLWLGTDAPFGGVNMDLATDGVGSSEDFDWEYWDGTSWSALTVTEQDSGSASFTGDGNFYFTPPADWFPYSVNGSTDLYYIRGHLEDGSYSTDPIENRIKTDILLLHYQDNIIEENQTLRIPAITSGKNPPILYWALNEGYGTAANDSSDHNNNGTISGATWQSQDLCYFGNCLYFDGSDDEILRSDDPQLDADENTSFTIQAWIRHPDISTNPDVIAAKYEGTGGDGGYRIQMESDGDISFGIDDENTSFPEDSATSTTADYDDNNWHHITAVKDGTSSIKLYIDGELIDEDNTISADTSLENNDDFYVGIDGDGSSNAWSGFIDEIKVYRYARLADEIKTDFATKGSEKGAVAVLGQRDYSFLSKGLVGYWKLNDNVTGDSQTILDYSGNGNDGTTNDGNATLDCTIPGKFNLACDFDGSDDYVEINNTELPKKGPLTVSVWVNMNSFSSYEIPVSRWSNSNFAFEIQTAVGSPGKFSFNGVAGSGEAWVASYSSAQTGQWYHLVGVADETSVSLFVNGVEYVGNYSWTYGGTPTGLTRFGIRPAPDSNYASNDTVDEVRIYNRALSPSEIEDLYRWAPGPLGYWKLDENSGQTINDSSGNNLSGTLGADTSVASDDSSWATGKFGSGLSITGSTSQKYAKIPDNDLLDVQTGDMTVEAWFNKTEDTDSLIVSKDNCGNTGGWMLGSHEGLGVYYRIIGDTSVSLNANTSPALNSWHHLTGVKEGTTMRVYVDGVYKNSDTAPTGIITTDRNILIGAREGTISSPESCSYSFPGIVDDVRIYNYARAQKQIIEDMNAGHPAVGTPIGSTSLHLKFDEGYGDTANDSSPQDNDGDLAGANSCPGHTWCPSWSNSGKLAKALHFDGSDDVVAVSHSTSYKPEDEITITAWFNADDWDETFDITRSGNAQMRLYTAVGGGYQHPAIQLDFDSTGPMNSQWKNQTISAGEWHHIAGVYDGTNLIVYFDGIARNTRYIGSDTIDQTADYMLIGQNGSNTADGLIDEVKIYNFALTADQIKADMNLASAAVWGAVSTDGSGDASWSAQDEFCPPGQGSTCTAPIAHWNFDEHTGSTVNDISENSYTGTFYGNGTSHWARGKFGSAGNFDGTTDYVSNFGDILDFSGDFTLEAWVKSTGGTGVRHMIFDKAITSGSLGYSLRLSEANDKLDFSVFNTFDTEWLTCDGDNAVTGDNTWHHVTGVVSGSTMYLYVDGVLECTDDTTAGTRVTNSPDNFVIGYRPSQPFYWEGQIDEARVYNYARTPAQIAWDYNKGGPVGHWQLDNCEGTTAYDVSGNGNNGTITIGSSGDNTSAGTCTSGQSDEAWYNGATGKRNASLDFDGSDDYVDLGESQWDGSWMNHTITAWVKHDGTEVGTEDTILSKGGGAPAGIYFYIDRAGGGLYRTGIWMNSAEIQSTTTNIVNDENWHFVSVVLDASSVTFYTDGVPDGGGAITDGGNNDFLLTIGKRSNVNDNYFNGKIDDVKIFNYALTEEQIKTEYTQGAVSFN